MFIIPIPINLNVKFGMNVSFSLIFLRNIVELFFMLVAIALDIYFASNFVCLILI